MQPMGGLRLELMKRLLAPWAASLCVARHLAWYLSYQMTGEAREGRLGATRRASG
jgi:hypothetical protein